MRILATDEHQSRKEKMLQAVVHLFIKTGKPVGSATIVENYKVNLSPATIRNVLAELEKEGFLGHPHTSAGRVPTDKGYRFYVDSIVNIQRLAATEEQHIREEYNRRFQEIDDLMLSTTRVLSALSHCTGFVLPHQGDIEKLRRIELIPVNSRQVLGVLVSDAGFVRNQMIDVEGAPTEDALRTASRFLNERLSGFSVSEAQGRLLTELDNFQRQMSDETVLLRSLAKELFGVEFKRDVFVEGTSNILQFPEFHDYEAMRNFAQLVDEKETLGQMLGKGLNEEGIQVRIGSENNPELKEFSVVTSGYRFKGRPVGVVGILGPKRMEYERMMAIVNTVSKLINHFLEGDSNMLENNSHE